jgi:hypothetical protein
MSISRLKFVPTIEYLFAVKFIERESITCLLLSSLIARIFDSLQLKRVDVFVESFLMSKTKLSGYIFKEIEFRDSCVKPILLKIKNIIVMTFLDI